MRKTEEEILREVFKSKGFEHLIDTFSKAYPNAYPATIEAMRTFEQQESEAKAAGFAEWLSGNAYPSEVKVGKWALMGHPSEYHTTAQLYAIYLKNKF